MRREATAVSLYRTWRPKSFTDLVGQDAVVRTLRTALSSGKLAHAYLFSGPRGSGKTSAAKILARCIDCERGPTPDPDNTCDNCRAMIAGTALDVIEVDAASNRGIEEIRALRESVKFAPASMRMKVFIIDEAHMLTREGANAFLKTLEEPPAHAVFVLATTAPEALPATVLSRCQRYAFRRIPISVMIRRMREIADAEGIAIDDAALGAIAYRADGGLRDALTMLEQVAAYAGGAVDAATVEAAFGATGRQYARALVDAILGGDAARALRCVDEASDAGADMLGLVRGAIGEYRNLLVARIDRELLARDLSHDDADAVVALAGATPQPRVVRGLRLLADALAAGRMSGNPRLELETAVLRLVVVGEDPTLEALATRVALLESSAPEAFARASSDGVTRVPPAAAGATLRTTSTPARAAAVVPPVTSPERRAEAPPERSAEPSPDRSAEAPSPERSAEAPSPDRPAEAASDRLAGAPPSDRSGGSPSSPDRSAEAPPPERPADAPAPAMPTLQRIRSLWDRVRLRAEEKHKPLRGLLSRATVDAVDGDVLHVGVGDAIQEGLIRDRTRLLEEAIADVVGAPLRVVIKPRNGGASAMRSRTIETPHMPDAGAATQNGEIDLLAYARRKLARTESP